MNPLDIIAIPGHAGKYARRVAVWAWQAAGSPPINSAGRLYADQKYFWDGWVARKPGFNPADNPDDETQKLAHVRFVAFDIDPNPEQVRRLSAAGLIRPYPYEPWHWELPNVRSYAIVRSLSGSGSAPQTSAAIRGIQTALNTMGHGLKVDGVPGPKTTAAIKAFQRSQRLTQDGVWGPVTNAAYNRIVVARRGTVKVGSRGDLVKIVQRKLKLTVDGVFGPKTKAAVAAYQKRNKLTADGVVGPKTWQKLGY